MQSYQPPTPKTVEQMRGGFLRAMSDAGLKPTVVYHNLTPSELYEKVCIVVSLEPHSTEYRKRFQLAYKFSSEAASLLLCRRCCMSQAPNWCRLELLPRCQVCSPNCYFRDNIKCKQTPMTMRLQT